MADVIRVALDAMGGDNAPDAIVEGALSAVRNGVEAEIVLVGDGYRLTGYLDKLGASHGEVEIVHAGDSVEMDEKATFAFRRKQDSSVAVAARLVRSGKAQALVSAGNTGAVVSTCLLTMGRLRGASRPAIASFFPSLGGVVILIDAGATVDAKPKWLAEFAVMGSVYASHMLGKTDPRVGLLSIGEEPGKGNKQVVSAHQRLEKADINFIGHVQGHEMMAGNVDVIVTDGFTGNVVLKFAEGVERVVKQMMKRDMKGPRAALGGLLIKPSMRKFFSRFDYVEYGGAPLLGLRGMVIICHGGSSAHAIARAVEVAAHAVRVGVNKRIREALA
jgi:glycerol-3-phosphate acyltransferase PlsX